ncbi:hypothetical protein PF005_g14891 [Phytophthora fragariae]|uniref:Uncharacterized protein n=1 Tax=Phytophthora fragariae TaxID=53985 RepID=A0A6A3F0C1_9STRA|nr:hypothetical protein PF009_g14362 [Phytophthora fragariae]KAE9000519.1 hypothetical protein PF011_g14143 [Phytophthora fragariae]KAE9102919.1 hypothetical protein PF006_g22309 [Phytophthora fragariae]KAE9105324.1 hypothetical protein PF010_g13068 [Phytophthora fragariae]KAE9110053.1 hypothetical protein PF007_g12005 [Phytophthora fragariae]
MKLMIAVHLAPASGISLAIHSIPTSVAIVIRTSSCAVRLCSRNCGSQLATATASATLRVVQ